jgi:hypothetical protein
MHLASTGAAIPHNESLGVPFGAQFFVLKSPLAGQELTRSTQMSAVCPSMLVAPICVPA